MKRLLPIFLALLTGAFAARPNVLLICVDDLKPVLGCYGDAVVRSPQIDRLAARGTRFERAYCNQAVCAPSRNSLMTGLRPTTIGIYDLETFFRIGRPDAVTVGEWFKSHGWRTEGLGKIFHEGGSNRDDAQTWSVPHWKPRASYYGKDAPVDIAGEPGGRGVAFYKAPGKDDDYSDGRLAAEAVRRLENAAKREDSPFFIAVGFAKPHLPFVAPAPYWELYDPERFQLPAITRPPAGAPKFAPSDWGELRTYRGIPREGPLPHDLQRSLIHGYHAAVSYTDTQIGRLLDALDRLGLADNTIVVLWGDHGWHLGDHGMWCKHTNYEQANRIPLIVSAPGRLRSGAVCRSLVETVDLYPTLCELAGIGTPPGLDGASFAKTLTDPSAATKEAVFHVYPRGVNGRQIFGRAVRTDRHRLVEWKAAGAAPESAVIELYDYQTDPLETENLAARQSETVESLRAILARQPEAKPSVRGKAKPPKPKG